MIPQGIQRRRAKGWRAPEGAIYVGRPGPWGNPFVVGVDGNAARCVELYGRLLEGYLCLTSKATIEEQRACVKYVALHLHELVGKDLMCWCRIDRPCHRNILLAVAAQRPLLLAPLVSVDDGRIERGERIVPWEA